VREIRNLISIKGMAAFNSSVQLVVFMAVMFAFNWKLASAFLLIMLAVYLGLIIVSGRILRPAYETLHEMDVSFSALQDEIVQGIVSVKASGREDDFKAIILRNMMQLDRKQVLSFFNVSIFNGITEAVWITAGLIFLWVIALLSTSVVITTGTLAALIILVVLMYGPVQSLVNFWADLQSAALLSQRLTEVIEWPPEQADGDDALKRAPTLQGKVEFRDVTVQHGGVNSPTALAGISFTAMPGQRVAIVGRSGSGKTVLSQTIASLLHPASGTILFDGVPSTEIRLRDLRQQVGLVLKQNRIFTGTIKSNIAFGMPEVDDSRVSEICRRIGIAEQINALPHGIDTIIGEDDYHIPGALRQGIALARALYPDPAILILDQISNSLDVETESTFFEHLNEAFRGRLVFIATKRISLARSADMILVLDHGNLVEAGRHDELMSRRGLYYHMASRREG
jgi:subfamily B ATP-binding cassette protein HlyB/CyaB